MGEEPFKGFFQSIRLAEAKGEARHVGNLVGGRGLTQLTGTTARRFGPDKRAGFLIGGSYDWNGRGSQSHS
jgi:hypothetical protein